MRGERKQTTLKSVQVIFPFLIKIQNYTRLLCAALAALARLRSCVISVGVFIPGILSFINWKSFLSRNLSFHAVK